jgi:hypothetical protein
MAFACKSVGKNQTQNSLFPNAKLTEKQEKKEKPHQVITNHLLFPIYQPSLNPKQHHPRTKKIQTQSIPYYP